jgi:hypothetical protein
MIFNIPTPQSLVTYQVQYIQYLVCSDRQPRSHLLACACVYEGRRMSNSINSHRLQVERCRRSFYAASTFHPPGIRSVKTFNGSYLARINFSRAKFPAP